jgi:hypothetical protein
LQLPHYLEEVALNQMRLSTLKGNIIIAPMASNIAESVNPIIRKGKSNSHRRGKRNMANTANGQLTAKRRNQSTIAISVRISSEI